MSTTELENRNSNLTNTGYMRNDVKSVMDKLWTGEYINRQEEWQDLEKKMRVG